jgi:hypothetical protein
MVATSMFARADQVGHGRLHAGGEFKVGAHGVGGVVEAHLRLASAARAGKRRNIFEADRFVRFLGDGCTAGEKGNSRKAGQREAVPGHAHGFFSLGLIGTRHRRRTGGAHGTAKRRSALDAG